MRQRRDDLCDVDGLKALGIALSIPGVKGWKVCRSTGRDPERPAVRPMVVSGLAFTRSSPPRNGEPWRPYYGKLGVSGNRIWEIEEVFANEAVDGSRLWVPAPETNVMTAVARVPAKTYTNIDC